MRDRERAQKREREAVNALDQKGVVDKRNRHNIYCHEPKVRTEIHE